MRFLLKTCGFALVIWFVLCCLFPDEALGAPGSRSSIPPGRSNVLAREAWATPTEVPGGLDEPEVHAYCIPETVAIGEPFTLHLDILHDSELRVLLEAPEGGGSDDEFGDSWVLLQPRRVVHLPLDDGTPRTLTQVRWRLFGLEPGELELPVIGADALTSGTVHNIEARTARVNVLPELAEGEDAPRPLQGFQPPPLVEEGPLGTLLLVVLGGGLLLLGVLAFLLVRWFLWRRAAPRRSAGPTALDQLEGLDPSDEGSTRELHYALARLTRLSLDGPAHAARAGQTDEEWITTLRAAGALPTVLVDRAEVLLGKCAEVKYGASQPTRWAATEAWEEARALCMEARAAREHASRTAGPAEPREVSA